MGKNLSKEMNSYASCSILCSNENKRPGSKLHITIDMNFTYIL